jgi:hypothetical protein
MTHKKSPQREHVLPDRCFALFLLKSVGKIKERNSAAVQAKKAYSGGRGISQPKHDPGTRRGCKVSAEVEVYRNQNTTPALEEGVR